MSTATQWARAVLILGMIITLGGIGFAEQVVALFGLALFLIMLPTLMICAAIDEVGR